MPFHQLSDDQRRALCKAALDSLEIWLRRVIHFSLNSQYGSEYLDACDATSGDKILKREIREKIKERAEGDRSRYPRYIDAALLDDEISIVCHPRLYASYFKPFFHHSFPNGNEHLRTCLERLVAPRNALAHSNPISVRQAEQVICYSHDVIDSIKHHMDTINMGKEFNVPKIIRVTSSSGAQFDDAQIHRTALGTGQIPLTDDPSRDLTVGDTLSIEVEVDPSFSPESYRIEWRHSPKIATGPPTIGNRLTIEFQNQHVGENFVIECTVISNKDWHRFGSYDHRVLMFARVLPNQFDAPESP